MRDAKYLTAQEVAEKLGIQERQVYRWAERGKIPGAKILDFGGKRFRVFMFDKAAVERFSKTFGGENNGNA